MDGLWATKSEGVGLIVSGITCSFQDFQPMSSWSTNITDRQTARRTDRQTDGQTKCNHKTMLCTTVYRAVKMYANTVTLYGLEACRLI